jgi:hypothetical protein
LIPGPSVAPPLLPAASGTDPPSFAATLRSLLALPPSGAEEPRRARAEPVEPEEEAIEALAEPPALGELPAPPPIPRAAPEAPPPAPVLAPLEVKPELIAQAILRQAQVVSLDGGAGLHLELETPRLARVGLDLRLDGGRIEARFVASTAEECSLLRSGVGSLEAALRARGLEVGSVRVALAGEGCGDRGRQQRRPRERPEAAPAVAPARRRQGSDVDGVY